jgi:purine-binding chemotaxis protein CheW
VSGTFLVFEVSGRLCALPVEAIREIVHIAATVQTPGQPAIVEGFLNYHGNPVAVVSLSRMFGMPEREPGLYASVILLRSGGSAMGVLADAIDGVVAVDELQPLPAQHSFNDCAEAQFVSAGGPVILFNADRILLEKERRCIADLAEQARERLDELEP